jgi:aspartate aminotransferase
MRPSPDSFRVIVRDLKTQGADLIKLFASAGLQNGGNQTLSDEQLAAICGEAKSLGLRTVVHAISAQSVRAATLAGCTEIDHGTFATDAELTLMAEKVVLLTQGLNRIDGFRTLDPTATFYVFPNVAPVCNRLGVTSHGLAMFMLQGADDRFGIASLGGECFGQAGAGFLRFSCAEPNDRLEKALEFIPTALARRDRLEAWLKKHPQHRLARPYPAD